MSVQFSVFKEKTLKFYVGGLFDERILQLRFEVSLMSTRLDIGYYFMFLYMNHLVFLKRLKV